MSMYGVIKKLHEITGISVNQLSDLANCRRRPGRMRALVLENAARKMGCDVPAITWLYGNKEEIKGKLSNNGDG